jgi:hypothetical protein
VERFFSNAGREYSAIGDREGNSFPAIRRFTLIFIPSFAAYRR